MMMPANFTAVAENEMTYVVGGATLADILAPALTVSNWQKFNTNMVTIIGNSFVGGYVDKTLGKLFSGEYMPGDMTYAWFDNMGDKYFSYIKNLDTWQDKVGAAAYGVLNTGLNIAGNAAAIYNLATGTVKNQVSEIAMGVNGAAV